MLLLASVSRWSPLPGVFERWPRTLERQDLIAKSDGLIRFGLPGSRWVFLNPETGDSVSLVKEGDAGETSIAVVVSSETLPDSLTTQLERYASLALPPNAVLAVSSHPGAFRISGAEATALEGIVRTACAALGHSARAKYRASSTGPTDAEAISEYFNLRPPGPAA